MTTEVVPEKVYGLYESGWGDQITRESYVHPAKMARLLCEWIFNELLRTGALKRGDVCVDCFGGVGTTGIVGASRGVQVICLELESKFCELARANFQLHERTWLEFNDPPPIMVNGDSRKLRSCLADHQEAAVVLTSPPYAECPVPASVAQPGGRQGVRSSYRADGAVAEDQYGQTAGQLGAMQPGSIDSVISSPPYTKDALGHAGGEGPRTTNAGHSKPGTPNSQTYGTHEDNLGNLKPGSVEAVVKYSEGAESWEGAKIAEAAQHATTPKDAANATSSDSPSSLDQSEASAIGNESVRLVEAGKSHHNPGPEMVDGSAAQDSIGDMDGSERGSSPSTEMVTNAADAEPLRTSTSTTENRKMKLEESGTTPQATSKLSAIPATRSNTFQSKRQFDRTSASSAAQQSLIAASTTNKSEDAENVKTRELRPTCERSENENVCAIISSPPYSAMLKGDNTAKETAAESTAKRMTEGGSLGQSCRHSGYGSQENLGNLPAGSVDSIVSSPPYSSDTVHDGNTIDPDKVNGARCSANSQLLNMDEYGRSTGQLGNMKPGDVSAVVGSPPFLGARSGTEASVETSGGGPCAERIHSVADGNRLGTTPGQLGDMAPGEVSAVVASPPFAESRPCGDRCYEDAAGQTTLRETARGGMNFLAQDYGTSAGQLGKMPAGDVSAIVASPPFSERQPPANARPGEATELRDMIADSYGTSLGQLGAMEAGEVADALVTSPPYEGSDQNYAEGLKHVDATKAVHGRFKTAAYADSHYGETEGQIGNTQGETFWGAAAEIVRECFAILKPGGYAVWVVKAFVRDKAIVDFPGDWRKLCEHAGFVLEREVHAMLTVEDRHPSLFGDEDVVKTKSRMSFFRRLHTKKYPHLAIDHETVLFMRKP